MEDFNRDELNNDEKGGKSTKLVNNFFYLD